MPWLQFSLDISQAQVPLIEILFEDLGALSITLGDAGREPILEPDPGEERLWSRVRVTALFDAGRDSDSLRAAITRSLSDEFANRLHVGYLADQAWERAWLRDFQPMRFGSRLWVCPAGQRPPDADAITLELDPGLAFGTGTHPTTALCLEWLESQPLQGRDVLDYGCGSGILALAALKLGASRVLAIDHDPQALEAILQNAEKNRLLDRLQIGTPGDNSDWNGDMIVANILAQPLVRLEPELARRIRPGGQIALSGILSEQADQVAAAYGQHFEMRPPTVRGEWILLQGVRMTDEEIRGHSG